MSIMKKYYDLQEEIKEILLDIEAIECCEFHDDFYYSNYMEKDEVYELAVGEYKARHKNKDVPDDFISIIDEILKEAGDGKDDCPYCQENEDD